MLPKAFVEQKADSEMMEKIPDNVNDVSKDSLYVKTGNSSHKSAQNNYLLCFFSLQKDNK